MPAQFDGYSVASDFEQQLNKLAEMYPIEIFPEQWWKVTRTLGSTLNIIEQQLMQIMKTRKNIV